MEMKMTEKKRGLAASGYETLDKTVVKSDPRDTVNVRGSMHEEKADERFTMHLEKRWTPNQPKG